MSNIYIVLENLRSLYNIGAIFRTCSFFGIQNVILLGYSGKDKKEDGTLTLHKEILKTSLGAEKNLTIQFMEEVDELIAFARSHNLNIVSVEQSDTSVDISEWHYKFLDKSGALFVFGNEVTGVSKKLLDQSDLILEIKGDPKGHNSLNVEATAAIIAQKISEEKDIHQNTQLTK